MKRSTLLSILAATAALAMAATRAVAAGKPWTDMDYGPFMSMTLEAPKPAGNFAYKGIVVPLRPDRSAAMVFDTDLLRWSAGWQGGFIDWRNILYDGSHGTHCRIAGQQAIGTAKLPGWAKPASDTFDDPRELPFGPLPREWGKWRGVYRHDERVVLSYRIGDVDVLESPELIERDGLAIFVRRMHVGPRKTPLLAAVSDLPETLVHATGGELLRDGDRVRLRIPAGEQPIELAVLLAAGGADRAAAFKTAVANVPDAPASLVEMTRGGPARYKPIITSIEPGKPRENSAFTVDTLTIPKDNPWRALVRPGGLDFFKGAQRAAICTWDGDVWIVDGMHQEKGELTWTRFATGLFQPLGLVIRDDAVYILGRDQITRLHDLNGDGEADWYEAFNHDAQVTEHFHEFAMDLQLAPGADGDFYYMKGACHAKDASIPQHGTLMRVAADGSKSDIVCYGFRAPNGLAIGGDGRFYTTDQQGHWTPANRINVIEAGNFYGYNLSYLPRPKPAEYEPPIAWLHPKFDRSPAQPFFVASEKWGPLNGKLLVSSYGTGDIELIMHETVEGRVQGGAVKLALPQAPTGIMRSRFSLADGQLYVCGLFGWAGSRTQPGGLYRIRHTGGPLRMPIEMHAVKEGVILTFSEPLDEKSAADSESYGVARWNYRRTGGYGSPDLRVSDGKPGQEPMTVTSVRLSKDRRTVELKLADMRPAMQMQILYNLQDARGAEVRGEIQSTVHALGDGSAFRKIAE